MQESWDVNRKRGTVLGALGHDAEIDCASLAHFLRGRSKKERRLILQDFRYRLAGVRQSARVAYAIRVALEYCEEDVKQVLEEILVSDTALQKRADIGLIVTKPAELVAAKIALSIGQRQREDREIRGYRFWRVDLPSATGERNDQVVLTMTGKAGPEAAGDACRIVADEFEVGLFVLGGMAAGVRGKVGLGDVIAVETAIDIETGRLEESGFLRGPDPFPVDPPILRDINYFLASPSQWWEGLADGLRRMKTEWNMPRSIDSAWAPQLEPGVVLSGKKKRADGSPPRLRKDYHERVRIVEMEASGFAAQARELGTPWAIFKGVSDFGDPRSKDQAETGESERKVWQGVASLAAITAALNFVRYDFWTPSSGKRS